MKTSIETIELEYQKKKVKGKRLTVSSELPIEMEDAWEEVQKCSSLEFVAKGMISFKPIGGTFPDEWKEKSIVKTKMLLWGFIPFGGTHTLKVIKIDPENKTILTHEFDHAAKIWNHKIHLKKRSNGKIDYTDEIDIYGGILTSIIAFWAKLFYKHRQKRWLLIAEKYSSK